MKKLFIIVIVITLPLITFFQFSNYRRFHPPINYDYAISDQIDLTYHDQEVLKEYYKNAIEIGQLSRTLWFNEGIDIRFPDINDSLSLNYSAYYAQLKSRNQYLEARLIASKVGKAKGWSNEDVRLSEKGIDPDEMLVREESLSYAGLALGSVGSEVTTIQQILSNKGYTIPIDGVFGLETQTSLKSFQTAHEIFSTGVVDYKTYAALVK